KTHTGGRPRRTARKPTTERWTTYADVPNPAPPSYRPGSPPPKPDPDGAGSPSTDLSSPPRGIHQAIRVADRLRAGN
ncbi:hypothetical protein, partial [Pseudonocardia acaciae]|uniref:hypothetical protein n=1 Tax=Pseudonocardia acaciae TaxID=551276 RepID=UPI001B80CA17